MNHPLLYLDPWSGISGDMLLAALLDADKQSGRLEMVLRSTVDALGLEGTAIDIRRELDAGVDCTKIQVDDGEAAPLRRLQEMEQVIGGAPLSWRVRERALAAVRRLAEVEAVVHGCAVEEIHFHEIGAVDTLVDIVGSLALIEALGVEQVYVGTIPVGGGTVETAHGTMGLPAPATLRLLEGYPIVGGPVDRELTTPTGALLVAQLGAKPGTMPVLRPERIGYGGGAMKLEGRPNVLRVVLGSAEETDLSAESLVELETNIDDVSPEILAHTAEELRRDLALDAWLLPVQMKKGRPGMVLRVLVEESNEPQAVRAIFKETGTLGIRRTPVSRYVAERGVIMVEVQGEPVGVKWGRWAGQPSSLAAEFEDCAKAASAIGLPVKDVMQAALEAARLAMADDDRRE